MFLVGLTWFIIGLFIGSNFGVLLMCVLIVSAGSQPVPVGG